MKLKTYYGLFLAAVSIISTSSLADQVIKSSIKQVSLLELYTSQGCNSCPPADNWVSSLKHDERLWNSLIPIAFHVNYWDYIGWKDRFATKQYSHRQRIHARDKNVAAVYTPEFVVNGREWRPDFGAAQLANTVNKEVGVLKLIIKDTKISAQFSPLDKVKENLILNIALLGFDLTSNVNAGENKGQTLTHDFVVLGYKKVRFKTEEVFFIASSDLPKPKKQAIKYGLATWVSTDNDLTPIQAVGGYLEK